MIRHIPAFVLILASLALGGCWYGTYEYAPAQYLHRTDTITMNAGNDQNVNSAIQVIDPWLPGVTDRRIPGNGNRMVNAVERYRARQSGSGGQSTQAGASQGGASGAAAQSGSTGSSAGGSTGGTSGSSSDGTLPY